MKRIYLAAGALMLGTSALAWAAGDSTDKPASEPTAANETTTADASKDAGVASKATWWSDVDAKLASAGLGEKSAIEGKAVADKVPTAESEVTAETDFAADKVAAINADLSSDPAVQSKLAMAGIDGQTGTGGPLEEGGQVASADLTPRPATMNYPPCDPGPGDDRCIQLYEPGVRAQLASWNRSTGGLLDHQATTAMGGPYEPVETDSSTELAMNGDGDVDSTSGESAETELAHHTAVHQGMGGPVEAQSGYPPCDPGPGDDRCIQLYEPGVTGAGN
jgi:hypothetical protein